MKKLISCLIILVLTTGCSYREIANYNLKKNIKKSCNNYEAVVLNYDGEGEGESRGYAEIGYCDNKLFFSSSRVDNVLTGSFFLEEYNPIDKDVFKEI